AAARLARRPRARDAGPGRSAPRAGAGRHALRRGRAHVRPIAAGGRMAGARTVCRRYVPHRCHRQRRQHGGRHAIGGLAVVQPGGARPGFFTDDTPADDLAGRWRGGPAAARRAPLHHAVSRHGIARRATLYGVRHTGRRPAGPMDRGFFPAPCIVRHELAGGHRQPVLAYRPLSLFVLSAHHHAEPHPDRIAPAASHPGRAPHPRPRPGGRRALGGRAHQRSHARTPPPRREPAARGRQPARHAKLRGRPIGPVPGTEPDYQRSPISRFHFARRRLPQKQGEPTMTYSLRNALRGLVLAAGILPAAAMAAWPEKPVTLIVPWAAGGSTDILARMLSEHMTKSYGQPVIVENRSGASGNIGSAMVARAAPDGYTLLIGSMSTHTMNEALYDNMPFDGVKSFTPIAQLALVTNTMVVNPSVPANTVQEFIEYARANPQDIAYASAGPG